MGQYCDSKALEATWFNWLLSSATPDLAIYRNNGFLYTKILGVVQPEGCTKTFKNPLHPTRSHVIISTANGDGPIYFNSYNGRPSKPTTFSGNKPKPCTMPTIAAAGCVDEETLAKITKNGYGQERPEDESWHSIMTVVWRICQGIASKFNLPNEEVKADLANDALLQVSAKIKSHRLIYTPGRAPVFNLLTTTIHRIMYSLLNRDAKAKQNALHTATLLRGMSADAHRRSGRRTVAVHRYGSLIACST